MFSVRRSWFRRERLRLGWGVCAEEMRVRISLYPIFFFLMVWWVRREVGIGGVCVDCAGGCMRQNVIRGSLMLVSQRYARRVYVDERRPRG